MFDKIKLTLKMYDWEIEEFGDKDFDFYIGTPYTGKWDYYVLYDKNEKEFILKEYSGRFFDLLFKTSSIEEFEKYIISVMAEVEEKNKYV